MVYHGIQLGWAMDGMGGVCVEWSWIIKDVMPPMPQRAIMWRHSDSVVSVHSSVTWRSPEVTVKYMEERICGCPDPAMMTATLGVPCEASPICRVKDGTSRIEDQVGDTIVSLVRRGTVNERMNASMGAAFPASVRCVRLRSSSGPGDGSVVTDHAPG